MSKRLELQLQQSGTDFAFDVEGPGPFSPRAELVYLEAIESPSPVEVRYFWEFTGKLVASNADTLWSEFETFRALFETPSQHPTYAQIVRDPDGDNEVVWKLDNTTYEQLRVDSWEKVEDPDLPQDAEWVTYLPLTIRISSVRKEADADGIVRFDQQVIYREIRGLREIEWRTTVGTRGGDSPVDAASKARSFASIDVTALGDSTFAYQTGNTSTDSGVEITVLDADERTGANRTPTLVEAISIVRQQGIVIGASGPGNAPSRLVKTTSTETNADETIVTTTVEAEGPNAEQAGLAQAPANPSSSSTSISSDNVFFGRWTKSSQRQTGSPAEQRTIRVQITGGIPVVAHRAIAGGLPPRKQIGAIQAYRATVEIVVRRQGGSGLNADMKLPPLLGEPWVLIPQDSVEGEPEIDGTPAARFSQNKWVRQVRLVYEAATRPQKSPAAELINTQNSVETYLLAG